MSIIIAKYDLVHYPKELFLNGGKYYEYSHEYVDRPLVNKLTKFTTNEFTDMIRNYVESNMKCQHKDFIFIDASVNEIKALIDEGFYVHIVIPHESSYKNIILSFDEFHRKEYGDILEKTYRDHLNAYKKFAVNNKNVTSLWELEKSDGAIIPYNMIDKIYQNQSEIKYTFILNDKVTDHGTEMFRIKAMQSFGNVRKGEIGGYMDMNSKLNHFDNSWIYPNSYVSNCSINANSIIGNRHFSPELRYNKCRISDSIVSVRYANNCEFNRSEVIGPMISLSSSNIYLSHINMSSVPTNLNNIEINHMTIRNPIYISNDTTFHHRINDDSKLLYISGIDYLPRLSAYREGNTNVIYIAIAADKRVYLYNDFKKYLYEMYKKSHRIKRKQIHDILRMIRNHFNINKHGKYK